MSENVCIEAPIEAVMAAIPSGYKVSQVPSDDGLMYKLGFTHAAKERRRDVYTKLVEREVKGGVKITDRAYVLEIAKSEAKGCTRATYSLNGRNIFAMDLMCDYHRARHIAIKAAAAWCRKSWSIKEGVAK